MNEITEIREISGDDFVQVKYPMIKRLHELGIKNGNEIMLFCKIFYLQADGKDCIASNEYFANLFCLSDRQIRDYLADLKDKGLIKTFEKKLGMKTTTRYIHVQYDVLGAEDVFLSSNKGAEETRQTSGRNTSKEWKKSVKGAEDNFHHIEEDKRIEKKDKRSGTKVPKVASLQNASLDEIDFKSKLTSISNETAKRAIDKNFEDYKCYGYDDEKIIESMIKEMTGAFYQCDKETVIQYVTMKLKAEQ